MDDATEMLQAETTNDVKPIRVQVEGCVESPDESVIPVSDSHQVCLSFFVVVF